MSKNRDEDAIMTFKECMVLLVLKTRGFEYEILGDMNGNIIGCTLKNYIMKDNFERFGSFVSFVSIDAMKRGIKKCLCPCLSIFFVQ